MSGIFLNRRSITIEDGTIVGGAGSAVLEFMADHHYNSEVIRMGMPDRIVEHGEPSELYAECGYDTASIVKKAKSMLGVRQTA